jgi:hypothetical protein
MGPAKEILRAVGIRDWELSLTLPTHPAYYSHSPKANEELIIQTPGVEEWGQYKDEQNGRVDRRMENDLWEFFTLLHKSCDIYTRY